MENTHLIIWDWKAETPFDEIFEAVRQIVNSGSIPYHYLIDDGDDQNYLMVAPRELAEHQVQEIFELKFYGDEEE